MTAPNLMPEEFLQYVWENRLFYTDGLKTVEQEAVEIIQVGKRNRNSGPDFLNAKIKIDSTIWVGNVEIHKKASDWYSHNHHTDEAYNNVILHVVEHFDQEIFRSNGGPIPVLELKYPEHLKQNYLKLLEAQTWIPCQNQLFRIDPIILQLGFNRLMIERLEHKTSEIMDRLEQNKMDWNETFYQFLARMFGFKVNALPFEMLAKSLPLQVLAKHKNSLFQIEALLFGNSGLLNEQLIGDDYFLKLREEYSFLYKKYGLKGIEGHLWKFMRLRPVNFSTIRISQFARLVYQSNGLFSQLLEIENLEDIKKLFRVEASEYWNSHYSFNKTTVANKVKEIGESSVNSLIINVVVPFLFVYGEKMNKENLKNRALLFLENLPAEENSIVKNWENLGVSSRSAFESQALLLLKNEYCDRKKCLNCQIGVKLVKNNPDNL